MPAPSQFDTVAFATVVQTVPSGAAAGDEHLPVEALHVPATWHWSGVVHTIAGPAMQLPCPPQVSGVVHALLSALHEVPLALSG